ncbi:hypothetical protein Q4I28_005194 [Leishmania naiffi]|uniref:Integral membrane protein n=1 Tax=Leishmania naiffi TaxID=5678 RepID=A0AAW3BIA6_9TRYP
MRVLRISVPLMCFFYHFVVMIVTFVNYIIVVRLQDSPQVLRSAYLAFCVIEAVAYATGAGPLFVYSYKYGKTSADRLSRLLCGIAIMFLFSSVPMLFIEVAQFLSFDYQFRHPLDGTVFFLHGIAWIFGGCIAWFAYMRVVADYLQRWRGPERQIIDDSGIMPSKDVQLHLVKRSQRQPKSI